MNTGRQADRVYYLCIHFMHAVQRTRVYQTWLRFGNKVLQVWMMTLLVRQHILQ